MAEELLENRDGRGIVTLTLNRPEKLNALTKTLWAELGRAFRRLHEDDGVRCIVLRGAGTRSFAPGNDISEFDNDRADSAQAKAYGAIMHETLAAMAACRHPSVAMIHGICVGGGLEIAGHCDIRICGRSSRFGVPIAKLGLVMAYPEISGLVRLAGPVGALEILLEGRVFDADEALARRLITRAVADDQVEAEAMAAAVRIAEGAPLVHRWHKQFVRRLADPRPLSPEELDEGYACFDTRDFHTGLRAFLAKEKPTFEGR